MITEKALFLMLIRSVTVCYRHVSEIRAVASRSPLSISCSSGNINRFSLGKSADLAAAQNGSNVAGAATYMSNSVNDGS